MEAPWNAKHAKEWDQITMKQFIEENSCTQITRDAFLTICRLAFCQEPHQMSLLFFLWYMACGNGFDRMISVTDGGQERKFVGGSMQLSERMAKELGDKVKLSSPVVCVEQKGSKVMVQTASGDTFTASYVIGGMPLPLLNRITFDPPLPPKKLQMIQRMPMGSVIKAMTYYDRPYWVEKGLSGQMYTERGPVLYVVDDTKPDGSHPCLIGFILAETAIKMSKMSMEERKRALAEHYAACFHIPELRHPINYVDKNWMEEQYSGGATWQVSPPGTLTSFGPVLREPFHRMYFAGTETATSWVGYMNGAVQAGERAAREVLHQLGKIPSQQIWQEEEQSPDFPEIVFKLSLIERALPSVPTFLTLLSTGLAAAAGYAAYRLLYKP